MLITMDWEFDMSTLHWEQVGRCIARQLSAMSRRLARFLISTRLSSSLLCHETTIEQLNHLCLQHSHLSPLVSQFSHTLSHTLGGHQILHDQQIKFFPKREEMRK